MAWRNTSGLAVKAYGGPTDRCVLFGRMVMWSEPATEAFSFTKPSCDDDGEVRGRAAIENTDSSPG